MDNLKGMGWMSFAMLTFALADMFIVIAARELPPGQIIVFFGLLGVPMLASLALWRGVPLISSNFVKRPVMVRNLAEIWGTIGVIYALSILPFSLVSSILQANPLLVTLGAALFLREHVGWRRWTAILIGLLGVLIILRPSGTDFDMRALLAVIAVTGLSARDLCTRFVPKDVPSLQVATYGFASTIPAGFILSALAGGPWVTPSLTTLAVLAGAAVMGASAYLAITNAMRVGDVAVVTPFRYTRLIFAFAIAMVVFGERPDLWTWVGSAIVIATGIYTLLREGRNRRSAAARG